MRSHHFHRHGNQGSEGEEERFPFKEFAACVGIEEVMMSLLLEWQILGEPQSPECP